jgi:hypothetical protein
MCHNLSNKNKKIIQKGKVLNSMLKVVIVMACCNRTKQNFGIRFEENQKGRWTADWAFAVKETYAKKEGYDHNTIAGTFMFDNVYPGCPYCRAKSIFKCGCGKVNCWNRKITIVTCAWCGQTNELSGRIETLSAGVDY